MQYPSALFSHLRLLPLGCACILSTSVMAGGLQVAPISLQMQPAQQSENIWLSNTSPIPVAAQVRVFQWTQQDNQDLLTPSTALSISPPLVEIAPGAKQLVRVLRTGAAPAVGTEKSFRLIVDELPIEIEQEPAEQPLKTPSKQRSINMHFLMRYSVPVFISATAEDTAPSNLDLLSWQIDKSTNPWRVRVDNKTTSRVQLADLQGIDSNGQLRPLQPGLLGYVLAGSSMQWTLPTSKPNIDAISSYQVMINSETKRIHVQTSSQP